MSKALHPNDIALLHIGATLAGIVAPNAWLVKHADFIRRWPGLSIEERSRYVASLVGAGELTIRKD